MPQAIYGNKIKCVYNNEFFFFYFISPFMLLMFLSPFSLIVDSNFFSDSDLR